MKLPLVHGVSATAEPPSGFSSYCRHVGSQGFVHGPASLRLSGSTRPGAGSPFASAGAGAVTSCTLPSPQSPQVLSTQTCVPS